MSPSKYGYVIYGFIAGMAVSYLFHHSLHQELLSKISRMPVNTDISNSELKIPMADFPEPAWRPPNLLSFRTVVSTPFARCEVHKVRTDNGLIVEDWIWTDERTHVNILVHMKDSNKYLMFIQKKYGLKTAKYAPIGGLFNEGETDAAACAHRELLEEAGLVAEAMVPTGEYRVQVNRGGGTLHTFLARNCTLAPKGVVKKAFEKDYESQRKVYLTAEELIRVTLRGEVGEAQWVAAVALGLLHEEYAARLI